MEIHYFKSPLGTIKVRGDAAGIQEVKFDDNFLNEKPIVPIHLQQCVTQLNEYFSGERNSFDLKLNPEGTDFQKTIWKLLQALPFGRTISYLKLARSYGKTKAVRAVAAAIGKNPILIIIPCHRVIGSDGTLVGYSGGIPLKKQLLELEGFPIQTTIV